MEKITNPWNYGRMTNAEKYSHQVGRIEGLIADARRVLAWQIEQGYEPQAENSRALIVKLESKLAKLV